MRYPLILVIIASLAGLAFLSSSFLRERRIKVAARQRAQLEARDVFNLHPGTKVLWDGSAPARGEDPFRGYRLPSGRVVRRRYWKSLEGVKAKR